MKLFKLLKDTGTHKTFISGFKEDKKFKCAWCNKEFDYGNDLVNHEHICSPVTHSIDCNCDKCERFKESIFLDSKDLDIIEYLLKYETI